MAEHTFFWGGDHIGDIASDWRVSDSDFAEFYSWAFGLGEIYEFTAGLPGGMSLKTSGGVLFGCGSGSDIRVTEVAGNVRIQSGKAIVDGRLYYQTSSTGIDISAEVPPPVAGTDYYLIGLRNIVANQQIRYDVIGPETVPANLTQPFTPGTDVLEPLAVLSVDNGGTYHIYDCRRILRPAGAQFPVLLARRGDAEYSEWDVPNNEAIEVDSRVGILYGCVEAPKLTVGSAQARAAIYLGSLFEYGIAFITVSDTDPNKLSIAQYRQEYYDDHLFQINLITNDGSAISDVTDVFFIFIGKLSSEWGALKYPAFSLDETFVVQSE